MIFLDAVLLNYSIVTNKTIKMPSYIISLVCVLFSLPLIHLNDYLDITISLILLTLTYNEIISLGDSTKARVGIFKSGFFIGIITLINFNFLSFYFIAFVSLIYYSQFTWKNLLAQILGLIYPSLIFYACYFLGYEISLYRFFDNTPYYFSNYTIYLLITFFFLILSMKELYHNYYRKTEKAKKAFNILFMISTLILIQTIVFKNLKFVYFSIIPLTVIVANYLIYIKHKKVRTFLLGLLIITFMLQIFYP